MYNFGVSMEFQSGQFQSFRSTSRVHLGAIQQDLPENTIVQFDGQTLRWAGKDYNVPALMGGIKAGWLVPVADNVSHYVPKPAGVKVRPAQSAGQERGQTMSMEEASEEEQVVGTLDRTNDRREVARKTAMTPAPIPDQHEVRATVKLASAPPVEVSYPGVDGDDDILDEIIEGDVARAKNEPVKFKKDLVVDQDMVEDQEARPIARLGDPKKKTVLTDVNAASREISRLDSTPHKPKVASPKSKVASETEGGEPITSTLPGGATGDVAVATTGDDLADLLPDAASSGLPKAGVTGGIQWDTSKHWKERVKTAVDLYGNDKSALRQVIAMESPSVVKQIQVEMGRRGIA